MSRFVLLAEKAAPKRGGRFVLLAEKAATKPGSVSAVMRKVKDPQLSPEEQAVVDQAAAAGADPAQDPTQQIDPAAVNAQMDEPDTAATDEEAKRKPGNLPDDGRGPDQANEDAGIESPNDVEQHEWAGDLDDTGEETDPKQAFARFTGEEHEQAWLDRADDGTLTGWVKDADGSIYRYNDTQAWATDVDDAGMTRADDGSSGDDGAPAAQVSLFAGVDAPAPDTEKKHLGDAHDQAAHGRPRRVMLLADGPDGQKPIRDLFVNDPRWVQT